MRTYTLLITFSLAWSASAACAAAPSLPDAARTPGASDATVTSSNYRSQLCSAANGTKYHTTDEKRPTSQYTTALKKKQLGDWRYSDQKLGDYEEDHLISLELGGDPRSEKNLWPEPYAGQWGAKVKDGLESELGRRVCLPNTDPEHLSLATARKAVRINWIKAYAKYVCTRSKPLTAIMKAHCK